MPNGNGDDPRQLITLAAGRGTRLGAGLPKCLLEIAGSTLLERQMELALDVFPSIDEVTVVVGFRSEDVRAIGGREIRYVENEEFETTNTATSLALALEHDPSAALLLNGDVVFDRQAMAHLRGVPNGALCEFKADVGSEEVQVLVQGTRITRIGKDIGGIAEAVGLYRLSSEIVDAFLVEFDPVKDRGRYYEDVLDRQLAKGVISMRATDKRHGRAIEIDTPSDLRAARRAFEDDGVEGAAERSA